MSSLGTREVLGKGERLEVPRNDVDLHRGLAGLAHHLVPEFWVGRGLRGALHGAQPLGSAELVEMRSGALALPWGLFWLINLQCVCALGPDPVPASFCICLLDLLVVTLGGWEKS